MQGTVTGRFMRLRAFLAWSAFRFIPALLLLAIAGSGYQVVEAFTRQANDSARIQSRAGVYAQQATAAAQAYAAAAVEQVVTSAPSNAGVAGAELVLQPSGTPGAAPASAQSSSSVSLVPPAATATTGLSVATILPSPTSSETPPAETPPAETPPAVAQVLATNTPRSAAVTLPAPNTPLPQPTLPLTPTPTSTITPTLTATPSPTLAPTLTATPSPTLLPTDTPLPSPTMTPTPRPLPPIYNPPTPDPSMVSVTAIPTIVPPVDRRGYDIVNIVLLGSDGEVTGDNFIHTDTILIVSINRTTGTVAMLGLPRDLFVYIPNGTMQRINVAYGIGEAIGWSDGNSTGGFALLRQTLWYNFGINVHYFALVELSGFEQMVDIIGGVEIAVDCPIEYYELIPGVTPDPARPEDAYQLTYFPVGMHFMNGELALQYVRSRLNSDDFDRTRRQQQLLRAIWRQARDSGDLARLPDLWSQGLELVETNLAFEDMLGLLPIALNLSPTGIENFQLIRTYHTTPWTTPDGQNVQLPNYDAIRQLLDDFYTPPTESQIVLEGASIAVYNGTASPDWDRVAVDRLAWEGFNAFAAGPAESTDYTDTILIDRSGQSKASSLEAIARLLNVRPENIRVEPDPNRAVDFEVILGSSYNSCPVTNVLPVSVPGG